MPIPTPNEGESQSEFLSRCIPFVLDEGIAEDQAQANAICMAVWEQNRSRPSGPESRMVTHELRLVDPEDGGSPRIVGYAAVFGQRSEDLGGFVEQIQAGAFGKTIQEADVRALWNHDPNLVLGRTRNGTLRLAEDDTGLRYEIDPPDTSWARDAQESIRRGDVNQSSFGFDTIRDEWEQTAGDLPLRTLVEVRLFDVSPVTYPAYPQTSAEVRARVAEFQAPAPPEDGHPGESDADAERQVQFGLMRRRLELAENQFHNGGEQ